MNVYRQDWPKFEKFGKQGFVCLLQHMTNTRAPDGANKKANTNTKTKTFREQCLRLIQRTCEHRYTQYISYT